MRLAAGLLIGIMLGSAAGLAVGAHKWRGSAEYFHQEARLAAILSQAAQMRPGGVLVIGDSITERVRMPFLCGKPALNAGIGRAMSADWLPIAPKVIKAARPSITVIEIGQNDHGRFTRERAKLRSLATFTIDPPTSTVDGVHPDARGRDRSSGKSRKAALKPVLRLEAGYKSIECAAPLAARDYSVAIGRA